MDADDAGATPDHFGRHEILARSVRRNDRLDQILRHILVIGEHLLGVLGQAIAAIAEGGIVVRSEEHTSELQSLMRISYAVLCLKKNKTITYINTNITTTHTLHITYHSICDILN